MKLITEKCLSAIIKRSIRTLQADRQAGTGLPYIKIGRSVRYDLDIVEKKLKAVEYISTTQYKD